MSMKAILHDKKGLGSGKIGALVGALIFIVLVTALGPTMFENLNISGSPTWMVTVLPIIIAAGLVMAIWKVFR